MPRKELDEEAYEGRRALLEALPKALKEVGLPVVVPALRANVGKPQPAKYDEVASTLRRADGTTKGEHVLKRALDAYNRAREAVATRRNVVPLKAIEPPAFYFVQQTLNPLGDLIGGRENEAAFARLTAGRNCADALDRLCRLQPPFPAEGEAGPSEAGPPTSPTVRGGTSALLRTPTSGGGTPGISRRVTAGGPSTAPPPLAPTARRDGAPVTREVATRATEAKEAAKQRARAALLQLTPTSRSEVVAEAAGAGAADRGWEEGEELSLGFSTVRDYPIVYNRSCICMCTTQLYLEIVRLK